MLFGITYTILWLILFLVLLIVEAFTLGLVTLWFAMGAILAFLLSLSGVSFLIQVVLFVFSSSIMVIYTRPIAKKYLDNKTTRTNADRLIGAKGLVIQKIDPLNSQGQVKIMGQIWSARASDGHIIMVDEIVEVEEISGVKLIVKQVEE